jgi:copper transport protein
MWAGAMRKTATALLVVVVVLLALGAKAPGAGAHAFLERSTPAEGEVLPSGQGPPEVILYFTEAIEIDFSEAYVVDTSGARWEVPNEGAFHIHTDPTNPGLIMNPAMPNGTYTVVWDVLSAVDGHRTKGFFTFFVGPPPIAPIDPNQPPPGVDVGAASAPPEALEVFARWANFAAMAMLIGAVVFPFLVLTAGVNALKRGPSAGEAAVGGLRLGVWSALTASLALLAATLLSLWVQSWLASGDSASFQAMKDLLSNTRFGEIWIARIALVAGAVVGSALLFLRRGDLERTVLAPVNTGWAVMIALSLAIPVTTSLNSHAAVAGNFDFQTAVDYVHLVAGGLWLGVLLQLLIFLLLVLPRLEERAGFLGATVRRFSWVAVPSVAVIVGTGIIQSIDRLGGIDELVDSDYGLTLAVKILLLAPLLAIAAVNLLIFGPRFLSFARDRAQAVLSRMRPWEWRFRVAVLAEVALAVTILGVTALLTNTSPPGSAQTDGTGTDNGSASAVPTPRPDSGFAVVDDMSISVWADPGMPGANQVNSLIVDQEGDQEAIQRVIFRFSYLEEDLGVSETEAQALHPPSHWIADTTDLSLPGNWEVEVIVRREGLLDTRATVELDITA